jgi:hypothetical protein
MRFLPSFQFLLEAEGRKKNKYGYIISSAFSVIIYFDWFGIGYFQVDLKKFNKIKLN